MKQRYDSYKSSGIDWIGDIPSHWNIARIRNIIEDSKNGIKIGPFGSALTGNVHTGLPYKVYGQWNIVGKDFLAGMGTVSLSTYEELKAYEVWTDDILISMMGTIGKCCIVPSGICPGIMDSHVVKIRIDHKKYHPGYFEYLYDKDNSNIIMSELHLKKKGSIMDGLNSSIIKDLHVIIPPIAEQEAIAAWLDEKCGKIDSAIAKVDQEIELIDELKQSKISRVVTRGLNPNVPLRPSGIDWIGVVPAHWKIARIRNIIEDSKNGIKIGPFGSALTGNVHTGLPYKVYGQWNIVGKDFLAGMGTISLSSYEDLKSYEVCPNDILISMMGTIGKCSIVPPGICPGIMDSHVVKIRLDTLKYNPSYFEYLYDKDNSNIIISELHLKKKGSIMDGLNSSIIKNLHVPIPPLSEQKEIADYLEKKCAEIDGLKEKLVKKRATLKELRQAIISEVVTGKRKVK